MALKIEELLREKAAETIDRAAEEAVKADLGVDIEALWDGFRASFRGADIRARLRAAADPLDIRQVAIAKLESARDRARQLVPVLEEAAAKAEALIATLNQPDAPAA